jgi:hypothetical protein
MFDTAWHVTHTAHTHPTDQPHPSFEVAHAVHPQTKAARQERAPPKDLAQLAVYVNHHSGFHGRMAEHLSDCGTFAATSNEDTFGIWVCAHCRLQAWPLISVAAQQ